MAETPNFEFALPEGVMGALEEAAQQFRHGAAGEGVRDVMSALRQLLQNFTES